MQTETDLAIACDVLPIPTQTAIVRVTGVAMDRAHLMERINELLKEFSVKDVTDQVQVVVCDHANGRSILG